jgi:hypothetical protein
MREHAHDFKPTLRDRSQFIRMLTHPTLNSWILLDRCGEPKKLARGNPFRHRLQSWNVPGPHLRDLPIPFRRFRRVFTHEAQSLGMFSAAAQYQSQSLSV